MRRRLRLLTYAMILRNKWVCAEERNPIGRYTVIVTLTRSFTHILHVKAVSRENEIRSRLGIVHIS